MATCQGQRPAPPVIAAEQPQGARGRAHVPIPHTPFSAVTQAAGGADMPHVQVTGYREQGSRDNIPNTGHTRRGTDPTGSEQKAPAQEVDKGKPGCCREVGTMRRGVSALTPRPIQLTAQALGTQAPLVKDQHCTGPRLGPTDEKRLPHGQRDRDAQGLKHGKGAVASKLLPTEARPQHSGRRHDRPWRWQP